MSNFISHILRNQNKTQVQYINAHHKTFCTSRLLKILHLFILLDFAKVFWLFRIQVLRGWQLSIESDQDYVKNKEKDTQKRDLQSSVVKEISA